MAIVEAFSGSATIGTTEFSLPNNSTTTTPRTEDGVYQVFIDLSYMNFGDQYTIRVWEKVVAAGVQQQVYEATITGTMAECWVSPSLILMHGWDVTVQKRAGTDRQILWSIRQVA